MLVNVVLSTRLWDCAWEGAKGSGTAAVAVAGKVKAEVGRAKVTGDGQGEANRLNHDLWAGEGVGEKILG
jgi:hypothetical protein